MRVIVFFDLPTETTEDRREYRSFRKFLIRNGFIMLQESVYSKIALNQTAANGVVAMLKRNRPSGGIVQLLVITEKQYAGMEYIVGEFKSEIIDSEERLIVL